MGTNKKSEFNKLTYKHMLLKLNEMYDEEARLIREGNKLKKQYEQLQEDKELLEMMIMYAANKQARG